MKFDFLNIFPEPMKLRITSYICIRRHCEKRLYKPEEFQELYCGLISPELEKKALSVKLGNITFTKINEKQTFC